MPWPRFSIRTALAGFLVVSLLLVLVAAAVRREYWAIGLLAGLAFVLVTPLVWASTYMLFALLNGGLQAASGRRSTRATEASDPEQAA